MAIIVGAAGASASLASSHAIRSGHNVPSTLPGIVVSRQMMRTGGSSITK